MFDLMTIMVCYTENFQSVVQYSMYKENLAHPLIHANAIRIYCIIVTAQTTQKL